MSLRVIGTCVVLATLALLAPAGTQAQASLTVGDEVIIPGGPAAPPKVIQTGFQLQVNPYGQSSITLRSPNPNGTFHQVMMTVPTEAIQDGTAANIGATSASSSSSAQTPFALQDMSGASIESLSASLSISDPAVRASAARAMGRARTDQDRSDSVRSLDLALSDTDPRVVREAVRALGALRDRSALPDLMNLVYNADDTTSVAAIQAVAAIGDPSVVPEMTKLARREDGPVARAAQQALAALAKARPAATAPAPASASAPAPASADAKAAGSPTALPSSDPPSH